MQTVSVRELKSNPSVALRQAAQDIVIVTNRDEPQAVLVDLTWLVLPDLDNVKQALAVSLFKQGTFSLVMRRAWRARLNRRWRRFFRPCKYRWCKRQRKSWIAI